MFYDHPGCFLNGQEFREGSEAGHFGKTVHHEDHSIVTGWRENDDKIQALCDQGQKGIESGWIRPCELDTFFRAQTEHASINHQTSLPWPATKSAGDWLPATSSSKTGAGWRLMKPKNCCNALHEPGVSQSNRVYVYPFH